MRRLPLAYLNREFLDSEDGRPVRILAEYFEPLRRFREEKIQDTVVFFGSSRVVSRAEAEQEVATARSVQHGSPADPGARERLVRAEKALAWSRYYEEARVLARRLTAWSLTLESPHHRFVVCSGGGPGIMEAANRGAREAGGKSIGLNINVPLEQGANQYITEGLGFEFRYFFMRKFWFAYLAKALVIFPGGFGTMDELFEFLTLAQTRKLGREIGLVLYGREYWDRVINFEPMIEWGAISEADVGLVRRCDTPEEAFEYLRSHLVSYHLKPATEQEGRAPGIARTRG